MIYSFYNNCKKILIRPITKIIKCNAKKAEIF